MIRPRLETMKSEDIAEGGDDVDWCEDYEDGYDDDGYEEYGNGAKESEIAMGVKKNRICQFCQKTFDRHSIPKRHLRIQIKEKPN